jgi:hypothetical protein
MLSFYIQKGKVKLTVLAKNGKEATIGVLADSFQRKSVSAAGPQTKKRR